MSPIIANDAFSACFGIVPAGDEEAIVKIVRNAVRQGWAIVPIAPGQKVPICTLTARQAKAADREAQEAAREAGRRHWDRQKHECGIAHALTDPAIASRVTTRLVKERGTINIGVEVGRSKMLMVDADTAAELSGFLADWSAHSGRDMTGRRPTVTTPGKVKTTADGEEKWVHKDGGHFWFTLPEGVNLASLPGQGSLRAPAGWVAVWRDHQALVPPSVRTEGAYAITGQVEPAPQWLIDWVRKNAQEYTERKSAQADRIKFEGDPIDVWSAATPWASLLVPDGWADPGLVDKCGCPIFTRPGDAGSVKSATAHEPGCSLFDSLEDSGHGPLKVWTDNPPDFLVDAVRERRGFITKLRYIACRDHGANDSAAMRALGLKFLGSNDREQAEVDAMLDNPPTTNVIDQLPRTTHLDDEFWSARPYLKHIREGMHSRQRSAPAGLGVILARTAAMSSHRLRIPAVVATDSGLSLLVAILAPSGVGKSSANGVGAELLPAPEGLDMPDQVPIGSGEGLVEMFFDLVEETDDQGKKVKVKRQVRHNAFVFVDEGQVLSEIGNRRGAVLLPTLRSVFSGSALGQQNASAERRRIVPGKSYTMGITVGLQTTLAGPILDDAAGGTPQRLLWFPASDPTVPDDLPEWPGQLPWTPPLMVCGTDHGQINMDFLGDGPVFFGVAESIKREIRDKDKARVRQQVSVAELDAHGELVQLKVAALLAVLDNRLNISEEDWQLAAVIRRSSDETRSAVEAAVAADAGKKANHRARSLADQAVLQDVAVAQRRTIDGARWIARKVWNAGPGDEWTVSRLRRDMDSRKKDVFSDALDHAVAEGWVVVVSEPGRGTDKQVVRPGSVRPR